MVLIIILAIILLITGCASTVPSSMEFRTAKTSARSEKNLKKAEEWGIKALELEIHATDAAVPYFLAIENYPSKSQFKYDQRKKMFQILCDNKQKDGVDLALA